MSRYDEPMDTVAVAADDAALDALGDDAVSWDFVDPGLQMLAAIRSDVSLELPAPSTSWASAAVDLRPQARRSRRTGRRVVVASAVTAAVLSVSGVAAAAITTGPGATLYPLHQLLTGAKPTASEHAAAQVRHLLKLAKGHLAAHRLTAAGEALDHATTWLPRVGAKDRADLPAQLASVQSQYAAALAAAGNVPGATGADDNGGAARQGDGSGDGAGSGSSGTTHGDNGKSGEHANSGNHGSNDGAGSGGEGNHGKTGSQGSSGSGEGSGSHGGGSGDTGSTGDGSSHDSSGGGSSHQTSVGDHSGGDEGSKGGPQR